MHQLFLKYFVMLYDLGLRVQDYTRAFSNLALILYNMGKPISEEALQKWELNVIKPRGGTMRGIWYLGKGHSFVLLDSRQTKDSIINSGATYI